MAKDDELKNMGGAMPDAAAPAPEAAPEGGDAPAAPPAAATPPKSKRDALRERLKKKYPDKNFDDDEEFAGQISDDYDASEKQLGEYKDREKQLGDFFDSDPRSAAFLMEWKNGKNPVTALVENFGMDFLEYMDDPEHQEELAKAQKDYLERVAKEKNLEDEYQKNLDKSLNDLEASGMDDDEANKGLEKLFEIVNDAIMGKISTETVKLLNNGVSHDDDVAKAGDAGEVRGRNAKITDTLRKGKQGDGTPHLGGGGAGQKPRGGGNPDSIFSIAAGAQ